MKQQLLTIGIITLMAGVLLFADSALSRYGYYHLMDGSADLYISLHRRMNVSLVVGIVLAVIGVLCMFLRFKK